MPMLWDFAFTGCGSRIPFSRPKDRRFGRVTVRVFIGFARASATADHTQRSHERHEVARRGEAPHATPTLAGSAIPEHAELLKAPASGQGTHAFGAMPRCRVDAVSWAAPACLASQGHGCKPRATTTARTQQRTRLEPLLRQRGRRQTASRLRRVPPRG